MTTYTYHGDQPIKRRRRRRPVTCCVCGHHKHTTARVVALNESPLVQAVTANA